MIGPFDHEILDLFEAAPDAMVVVDSGGTIVSANQLAIAMFEFDRDELIGGTVEMLIAAESRTTHARRRQEFHAAPKARPMGGGLRLEGRRRAGELFPVEISLSPFAASDGRSFVVAAVRDVTERERASDDLRNAQADLATSNERDRIARDLHDTVIQQLFAIGMSLQSVRGSIGDPTELGRLDWAVDELDRTILEVRTVIFGLQSPRGDRGLRSQIMYLAGEAQRTLGYEPAVRFTGLVDTMVGDALAEQVVLAAREALANVVRHSRAEHVSVAVTVGEGMITLVVADDGIGIAHDAPAGHGLRNLADRAQAAGGSCTVSSEPGVGTSVEWRVPLIVT